MGVDPALLTLASVTRPEGIYILSEAEAETFKLAMPRNVQPRWQLTLHGPTLVAEGKGAFEGNEYDVALWCPDPAKRRLILTLRLAAYSIGTRPDFGETRVKPYQHYVTVGRTTGYPTAKTKVPISLLKFDRKEDSVALSFGLEGPALDVLQSGETFGL